MTKKTFEVGKKYIGKWSGAVFECLWVDDTYAVLKRKDDSPTVMQSTMSDGFEEYIEPKVTKGVKYLEYNIKQGHFTHWKKNMLDDVNFIAKVEITHTEGVGVEYKVLEYYGSKK